MALDEASRHELHEAARRSFGTTAGDALMELLPPVGWADVARRSDIERLELGLDRLEVATRSDFDRLEAAIERYRAEFKRDLEMRMIEMRGLVIGAVSGAEHRILMWMFTTVLAGIAISTAVATAVALAV